MIAGAKSHWKSKPSPARGAQRAQTTLVSTRTRDPTETEKELSLSVSCGGSGQQQPAAGAGALGAADLGMAWALFEEVAFNPTIEPPEFAQDWGNRLLEGTNRTLCSPLPRIKEQWPHKRLTQTCLWVYRHLFLHYLHYSLHNLHLVIVYFYYCTPFCNTFAFFNLLIFSSYISHISPVSNVSYHLSFLKLFFLKYSYKLWTYSSDVTCT